MEKKLTEKQLQRLIDKKKSTKIKGFTLNGQKVEGILNLSPSFEIIFEQKSTITSPNNTSMPFCPKCGTGTLIKGKTAYGCSDWKKGCDFRYTFSDLRTKAAGKRLTKELVLALIKN